MAGSEAPSGTAKYSPAYRPAPLRSAGKRFADEATTSSKSSLENGTMLSATAASAIKRHWKDHQVAFLRRRHHDVSEPAGIRTIECDRLDLQRLVGHGSPSALDRFGVPIRADDGNPQRHIGSLGNRLSDRCRFPVAASHRGTQSQRCRTKQKPAAIDEAENLASRGRLGVVRSQISTRRQRNNGISHVLVGPGSTPIATVGGCYAL